MKYLVALILFLYSIVGSSQIGRYPISKYSYLFLEISRAYTDVDGLVINIELVKPVRDPSGTEGQFSVNINAGTSTVDSVTYGANTRIIQLHVTDTIVQLDDVTFDYTRGTVSSPDWDTLNSVTDFYVTNNSFETYYDFDGGKPSWITTIQSVMTAGTGDSDDISILTATTTDPRVFFEIVYDQDISLIRYVTIRLRWVSGAWDGNFWFYKTNNGVSLPPGDIPAPPLGVWTTIVVDLYEANIPWNDVRDFRIDFQQSTVGAVVEFNWMQFNTSP